MGKYGWVYKYPYVSSKKISRELRLNLFFYREKE